MSIKSLGECYTKQVHGFYVSSGYCTFQLSIDDTMKSETYPPRQSSSSFAIGGQLVQTTQKHLPHSVLSRTWCQSYLFHIKSDSLPCKYKYESG